MGQVCFKTSLCLHDACCVVADNLHMEALVKRRMTRGKRKWAQENPGGLFDLI